MADFNLAVIGAGIAGLATAAQCVRKGKKVILFAEGPEAGGAALPLRIDEYRFSTSPSVIFGFDKRGVLHQLHQELGISHNGTVLSPCYQIALPDRRISIFPEQGETIEELNREFPREVDKVRLLLRDARKLAENAARGRFSSFLLAHRKSGSLLRRYRFSREMTAFLDVQSRYFFHQPLDFLPLNMLVLLIDTTPVYFPFGFKSIADHLLDFLLKNGGVVKFSEPEPRVGQGKNPRLETSSGLVSADAVLLNTKLPQKGKSIFIAMQEQGIPVGMSHEVVCLPDYDIPEDFFVLSLAGSDQTYSAPKGKLALSADFPALNNGNDDTEKEIARIEKIIPFIRSFADRVYARGSDGDNFKLVSNAQDRRYKTFMRRGAGKVYLIGDEPRNILHAVGAARRIAEFCI